MWLLRLRRRRVEQGQCARLACICPPTNRMKGCVYMHGVCARFLLFFSCVSCMSMCVYVCLCVSMYVYVCLEISTCARVYVSIDSDLKKERML